MTKDPAVREGEIRDWLLGTIATRTGLAVVDLDPDEPLYRYGIDSLERVNVAYELEVWLGHAVDEAKLAELETINQVAKHLAAERLERSSG